MTGEMRSVYVGYYWTQDREGRMQAYDPALDRNLTAAECEERRVAAIFERKRRMRRIGETTAARWVAGYGR